VIDYPFKRPVAFGNAVMRINTVYNTLIDISIFGT